VVHLDEEVLLHRRCFRESKHVKVLDHARTTMQKDRHFFGALGSVCQLIFGFSIVWILVVALVPLQITFRKYLFLSLVKSTALEPTAMLQGTVGAGAYRLFTLLNGYG